MNNNLSIHDDLRKGNNAKGLRIDTFFERLSSSGLDNSISWIVTFLFLDEAISSGKSDESLLIIRIRVP
jgi:hypothetical protein